MSKYQAYPEYKDSSVEWLGQIPNDWQITKLKHIASIFGRIGFRGYTVNDIVNEGEGAIVLSPSNIFDGKFSLSKVSYLSWDKYYESPEIMVERNDILLVKTGSTYGKSSIIKNVIEPMTINPQMALIKKTKINPSFLAYWLSSELIKAKIEISNTGSGMPTMTQENINEFPITLPNKNYAEKIAAFLDHETAKIDTLIEKQQRLIELLKEKRQAVISHAVTKGLNPDAPMKNSGVEWLGEVPEHWNILKMGYECEVTKLTGFEYTNHWKPDEQGEIIALRGFNIQERYLDLQKVEKITALLSCKLSRSKLHQGDIVLPCTGTLGNASVIESDGKYHINQNIAKLTFSRKVLPDFAVFWLTSEPFRRMIDFNNTSGMQPVLLIGDIRNMRLPLPPLKEQQEIANYLKDKLSRFDKLIKKATSAINLIQERRTALISAAVTGKIDVRNWVAPTTSSDTNEAQQEMTA
ncbi:TPA: restriction endonuclease subunit S [Photobacterium damselae]